MQRGVTSTHYQTRNRCKQNNFFSLPPIKLTVSAENLRLVDDASTNLRRECFCQRLRATVQRLANKAYVQIRWVL